MADMLWTHIRKAGPEALIEEMRDVLEHSELRHFWQGQPFSRKAINARLKNDEHPTLMQQEWRFRGRHAAQNQAGADTGGSFVRKLA